MQKNKKKRGGLQKSLKSSLQSTEINALETPADEPLVLEKWLPFRLFTISGRVADILTDFYGPRFGLSRGAWRTMAIIANHKGISAKEICKIANLDQFAVSRAIAQLADAGYALRRPSKTDKRYASVSLTTKGWRVFEEISALAKRANAELTAQITPEEGALLDDILNRLEASSAAIVARGWRDVAQPKDDEKKRTR